jgi:soluble lytic murein transglycosylase-like protein
MVGMGAANASIGLGAAALALVYALGTAQAEVIEIAPNGAVTRQSGPGVTTPEGWAALALPARSTAIAGRYGALYSAAGAEAALSPALIEAVAYVESRHNANAVSPKGARGLMQLMPATAKDLGVDAADPGANARGGAAYLRAMLDRYQGDLVLALAAYNAGPNTVARYRGVPPFAETRAYVAAVLDRLAAQAALQDPAP